MGVGWFLLALVVADLFVLGYELAFAVLRGRPWPPREV